MLRRHVDLPDSLEHLWPELLRFELRTHHLSPDGHDSTLDALLTTLTPSAFPTLAYDDKLSILLALVKSLHKLDKFKPHLISRLDDISDCETRQKDEIRAEIKRITQERDTLIKASGPEIASTQAEIDKLRAQVAGMSRIDSKNVWTVIAGLERQTTKYEEELARYGGQIRRMEDKLGKVDDKIRGLSVRA